MVDSINPEVYIAMLKKKKKGLESTSIFQPVQERKRFVRSKCVTGQLSFGTLCSSLSGS